MVRGCAFDTKGAMDKQQIHRLFGVFKLKTGSNSTRFKSLFSNIIDAKKRFQLTWFCATVITLKIPAE